MQEKEMVGERRLWAAVVSQGKRDLHSKYDQEVLEAAKYFFIKGVAGDDTDLQTFNGVCRVHNLDPEKAAKKIWDKLKLKQQERIKSLLRKSGYESLVH